MKTISIHQIVAARPGVQIYEGDEIQWHMKHGAVYAIIRGDELAAVVWLSLLPEGMAVLSYRIALDVARKDLLKGSRYVMEWLSLHYSTIIGFVDTENIIGCKYAVKTGFVFYGNVFTDEDIHKSMFIFRSPKYLPK